MISDLVTAKNDSSWPGWRDRAGLVAAVSCGERRSRTVRIMWTNGIKCGLFYFAEEWSSLFGFFTEHCTFFAHFVKVRLLLR